MPVRLRALAADLASYPPLTRHHFLLIGFAERWTGDVSPGAG